MLPKVSVIIPFYNCPYVDQAIWSALHQTYIHYEVVAVSDGSELYEDNVRLFGDNIRLIRKRNGGTASALNAGIAGARGDYIAWLSSDDLFYPNKISRQLAFMRHYGAAFSYTDFDYIDSAGQIVQKAATPVFSSFAELYRSMACRNTINGCTTMIHRELFERIGYFDESLLYAHDYDFWLRVMLAGHHLYYLHGSLTMYRVHGQMGTVTHRAEVDSEVQSIREKYAASITNFLSAV